MSAITDFFLWLDDCFWRIALVIEKYIGKTKLEIGEIAYKLILSILFIVIFLCGVGIIISDNFGCILMALVQVCIVSSYTGYLHNPITIPHEINFYDDVNRIMDAGIMLICLIFTLTHVSCVFYNYFIGNLKMFVISSILFFQFLTLAIAWFVLSYILKRNPPKRKKREKGALNKWIEEKIKSFIPENTPVPAEC